MVQSGAGHDHVARNFNCSRLTVTRLVTDRQTGNTAERPRTGRPKATTVTTSRMNYLTVIVLCILAACGSPAFHSHIGGGSIAASNEFPWQGSLQVKTGNYWYHICKALTAASCLTKSASNYRLVFGMKGMNNDDGNEQSSSVSSYTKHPRFNANAADSPNDITVLKLTSSMDITKAAVRNITLAEGSEMYTGQTATISGWGSMSDGGSFANNLQKVDMTVLGNSDCSSRWSGISGATINNGHICGFASGKSACRGDFGSPMVVENTLTGIVSWDWTCTGSYPSVSTRVSYFWDWILIQ